MDRNVDGKRPLYTLLTFPVELLVYIFSFLTNARDKLSLSGVSRLFRSISQTPSLWREFIWPHLDSSEKPAVKNMLEYHGANIKQLCFIDHIKSFELGIMLHHCKHVVLLSLPVSTKLPPEQLGKVVRSMKNLQCLDTLCSTHSKIPELLSIGANLQELTIRILSKRGSPEDELLSQLLACLYTRIWIERWAMQGFLPRVLNVVSSGRMYANSCIDEWLNLNSNSPDGYTSYLKLYTHYKLPMDLFPALPVFQLEFGQSSSLPIVKASSYGLLGLEVDFLLLTSRTYGGKTVHKATLSTLNKVSMENHLNSDIVDLFFVTHFDASHCKSIHCGHLEQLALACPNLEELNLKSNTNCLRCLQGLHALASSCTNLHGLNLSGISVIAVESRVQLWKILASLRLAYLAIELCVMIPHKEDIFNIPRLIALYKKCLWLRALELCDARCCNGCTDIFSKELLLPYLPSLVHCIIESSEDTAVVLLDTISCCKDLKVFRYENHNSLPCSVAFKCNLKELYIASCRTDLSDTFMHSVSAHGGLVHVVLCVNSVTGESVAALITNSPKLTLYHVHTDYLPFVGTTFSLELFDSTLKKTFSNRKLFCCGSYNLQVAKSDFIMSASNLEILLLEHNTSLNSWWKSCIFY